MMVISSLERAEELAESISALPPEHWEQHIVSRCGADHALARNVRLFLAGRRPDAQARFSERVEAFNRLLDESDAARNLSGTLGGYLIKRALGSGNGGAVYLAEREHVGGEVALKVLLHPDAREPFLTEQRIHASLIHPGIPRFHHGVPQPGLTYFALEYVAGLPITEHCQQHKANLRERLRLMREVCNAVAYAQALYLHRDLKPQNILVKRERDDLFGVRVLDFGAAIPVDGRRGADALEASVGATAPGGFSYGYAAPEQYTLGPLTPATDVFALGVLLYELLSNTHPYGLPADLERSEEIVRRTLETDPAPVSVAAKRAGAQRELGRVSTSAWRDLDQLVGKAMHRDPAQRYPNVAALLEDLNNLEYDRPLAARPPSVLYRTGKFVRRHPVLVSVTSLIALLVGLFTWQLQRAFFETKLQADSAMRASRFMSLALSGGQWSAAPRADLTLGQVLDRLVTEAPALSDEPALLAELLARAGNLYTVIGRYDQAEQLLNQALILRKQALGPRAAEVAWDEFGLAELERERGQLDKAAQHAQRAAVLGAPPSRAAPLLPVLAILELARIQNAQGHHRDAAALLESAEAALPAELPAELRDAYRFERANAYQQQGRLDDARALHADILVRARRSKNVPSIAESLLSMADLEEAAGQHVQAERAAREAVALLQPYYGVKSPATLGALVLHARVLNSLARHHQAAELSELVLTTQHELYPQPGEQNALALHALCEARLRLHEPARAVACATRLYDLERVLHERSPSHAHVARSRATLAASQALASASPPEATD